MRCYLNASLRKGNFIARFFAFLDFAVDLIDRSRWKTSICLPELPVIIYNASYITAYGSTEKIIVEGPIEVIKALENIQS